tara:strand:+ start:116865 stop:117656 length:792 start_codon:yes stop_codon:yes gene_type:complete
MPECKTPSSTRPLTRYLFACCLITGLIALPVQIAAETAVSPVDSRKMYSRDAPAWLRAVGKLRVPGSTYRDGRRAHVLEDCSATLVTGKAGRAADTIITAWHCLANYTDLSKPIVFTLVSGVQQVMQREAYRLTDGGGMHADWAILRLRLPVPAGKANALLVHPGRADPVRSITMAGYSRDAAMGDYGNRLTFDAACLITAEERGISDSNCTAYKGASGGAVVQVSGAGTPLLSGVISEGDSVGLSTFVPVAVFRGAINQHLR